MVRFLRPDVLTTPDELEELAKYASEVEPPNCIVELGVFRGGSLAVLVRNAQPGVPVFGFDLFGREGTPEFYQPGSRWTKWWAKFSGERFSWEANEEAARRAAPEARILIRDTAQAGRDWTGSKVGLLYIDADHGYHGVRADWEAWKPHLVGNAIVAFDDYHRKKYPGIDQLVDYDIGLPVRQVGKVAFVQVQG